MSVLAVFVLFFIFLCVRLTTIHPPSQDLRGLKLSKLRNFHYLKNEQNPLFRHGHTVTTTRPFWPPATHRGAPFQRIGLSFLYLLYLDTGHSISLALYIFLTHVQRV